MSQSNVETGSVVRLSAGSSEAAIALAGGQPIVWRVDGRDLLWSGDPEHWGWRAPVLFPVVGQVNGGVVRIKSQTYDMPRHGFARTSPFRCLERGEDSARFRLDQETAETSFPLPFQLDLSVVLQPRSLSLEFTVSNPGSDILPYALGFHPAFPWPFDAGLQTDFDLRFEADEKAEVPIITPSGLLRSEHRSIPLMENRLSLTPELFRQDALVFLNARSRSWQFVAPSGSAIEMRLQNFPHLAAWTKPGAPFLSLEAWTGHADPEGFAGELVDKPSMILLPPDARSQHRVELAFRSPEGT
ncbi:aldose 1-epimerase family protein [Microvirga aerophila]|uniref:Aldose 1-epimerase n=1 Tax=Microvirga aerophila TaxID=670291 RepID=A0A512BKP2_9HYPH|nr:aldose 1-epimerase family protein [Microvirga aerophila]GEO12488.1 aldose 1-epimerase [Microvirga aerophila]